MLSIRKSDIFFTFLAVCGLTLLLLAAHAASRHAAAAGPRQQASALVQALALTDPCLFSEARYTRHPSQADRHAAFQDHPLSLEHFPAGGILTPPPGVR